MIAFKLTKPEMQSCGFCDTNNPATTKYILGKWVRPHNGFGPFAVFANWSDLIKFRKAYEFDMGPTRAFVCEIKKSKSDLLWYIDGDNKHKMCHYSCPDGTILASRVKLIKEVK